mmetsp:Transcript_12096/g.24341  ORF Transcript_12096/g.24341 Transcript_12096/m.24341 type:complete len:138 (-) Transcript_12096:723-1136(-)
MADGLDSAFNAIAQFEQKARESFQRMNDSLTKPYSVGQAKRDRDELLGKLKDLEEILREANLDYLYPTSRKPGDTIETEMKSLRSDIQKANKKSQAMTDSSRAALQLMKRSVELHKGLDRDSKIIQGEQQALPPFGI